MSEVFCERTFPSPLSDADAWAGLDRAGCCLAMHHCDWQGTLLSADGREMFCHFACPDAESLRIALRQAGSPQGSVWAGTVHDASEAAAADLTSANVLVMRRFEQPVAYERIQAAVETAGFLRHWFSIDRKRMLSLCRASDAESVRIALDKAAMPVERVLAVHALRR